MLTYKNLGNNGRLGNQLFQIASTIGIAINNSEGYFFPEYSYNKYLKNSLPTGDTVYSATFNEPHFHYLDIKVRNSNLHGYYQSEKYFKHCESIIQYYFDLKEEHIVYLKEKYKEVLSTPNCSLHIRRGDYIDKPTYHPVQPISYYETAMDTIGKDKTFLIFSDDISWCKGIFKGDNFFFVEEKDDILELFLMSYCDNNIMANSSFSWWASWLNKKSDKKVIAPKLWFGQDMKDTKTDDIYCKNWIVL